LNEYCPAGRTALPQWISEGRVNSPFIADWALAKPAERHRIPAAIAMVLTGSQFLFLFISTSPFFPELAPDAALQTEPIVSVWTQ
jgi:hypothetical protein